jgi:frataxin-like iron-binding protein CyaY
MKDDPDFDKLAREALTALYRALLSASDDYAFGVDFKDGVITLAFPYPPAKIAVSVNPAARQLGVSTPARSYKLDWDVVENTFVLGSTGQTVKEILEETISRQVKEEVTL